MTLDRATFEAVRDDLLKKRADIDALITALDVVFADDVLMSPRIVVEPQAKPPGVPAVPSPRQLASPAKTAPDEWADRRARAQTMYMQGKGPQEISDILGVSIRRMDKWIQRGKWKDQRRGILQERTPDPAPESRTHPDYDPEDEKKAKAMFIAGKTARSIAAALGRQTQTIYEWSSKGKWGSERAAARQATTVTAPLSDPVAERIRAQRRSADDAIIEQVRQEMESAYHHEKVNSFGEHAPRLNGRHSA